MGHLLLSWWTPLADCSRGLHCLSFHRLPEWLEPTHPLCWSLPGPATGLHARLCQTPSWSLWSCGTDRAGVVEASLWWLLKICSTVLQTGLKTCLFFCQQILSLALSRSRITQSMILLERSIRPMIAGSEIAWGCLSLVKLRWVIVSAPLAIPSSPRSSGISLSRLLLLPRLYSSAAQRECCPLMKTFLLSENAQPPQPLPSAQVGFQPLVWGSDYSG